MSMSKKHFELIAQVFQDTRPDPDENRDGYLMWLAIRNKLSVELKATNRMFNMDRFEDWTRR